MTIEQQLSADDLALIAQTNLRAFQTKTQQELVFHIVNDTKKLVLFDRAMLWTVREKKLTCEGVSGHTHIEKGSPVVHDVKKVLQKTRHLDAIQTLNLQGNIPGSGLKLTDSALPSILWIPITTTKKHTVGLWLERFNASEWSAKDLHMLHPLAKGYAAAWKKHRSLFRHLVIENRSLTKGILIAVLCLGFLRVPLRVIAPLEVIPLNPFIITAPLEGVISEIHIQPGDPIHKKQLLVSYDKRIPVQRLKIAEKRVEIAQSQLDRTMTISLEDSKAFERTKLLKLELAKEKIDLEAARKEVRKLEVSAPEEGIALFENPDEWRGKPVRIGEHILVLSHPNKTKIRVWIPERDNIVTNKDIPIKVMMNTDPTATYTAKLTYISDYSRIHEQKIPSFEAEALWFKNPPPDLKLGLKGTAVLYGDNVSLFYWLFRKPWATAREFFGW